MDIKVKEEVLEVHEDYSDVFFDCDIVKEEATIQEVNVPVQRRETATNGELMNIKITDINSKVKAKKEHKCKVCGKILKKAFSLKTHMLVHSEKRKFQCRVCLKTFKHKSNLVAHEKSHTEVPIPCEICKKIIKNSEGLRDHIKRQHERIKIHYECEKCGKLLSSRTNLKIHDVRVHERNVLTCPFCDMTFKNSYNHRRHVARHSENFDCKICFQKFKKRYMLLNHMGIHNPPKETFPCQICNKTFRLRDYLLKHQKIHSNSDNESRCIYCRKSFKKRSRLQTHMKKHHRGLPNVKEATPSCTICKKVFKKIANLKKHVAKIHPKRSEKDIYECAICGLKTKYKSSIERHMITHSTETPVACDTCGKKYKTKAQLEIHNFSHVAFEKNLGMKCGYCEKIFYLKNSLSHHTRDHHRGLPANARDPPFKCTVCQKSYENIDELKEHVTIHKNDFKCAICDKIFYRKQFLSQHILVIHLKQKSTKNGSASNEVLPDSTTDDIFDILEIDDINLEVEDY